MEKVAFIVCYNNEQFMSECMEYISWLKIPEGVETEVIGIVEAESMAAGYNAAMYSSDAKYKVYLHQDVFIINENFIQEIIDIFQKYPEYGMLGVLGSTRLLPDADYYTEWDAGCVDVNNGLGLLNINMKNYCGIQEVKAIDGMIMITQNDVEWREDIFDGFDFYDISQSHEFQKRGYKIGVPYQEEAWCLHFCGKSKFVNYEKFREKFCKEYGYKYTSDAEFENIALKQKEIKKRLPEIFNALEGKSIKTMMQLLVDTMKISMCDTTLCRLSCLAMIYQIEMKYNVLDGFFNEQLSTDGFINKYVMYQFLMLRLQYGKSIENMKDVLELMMNENNSEFRVIYEIAKHTVYFPERMVENLKWLINHKEKI